MAHEESGRALSSSTTAYIGAVLVILGVSVLLGAYTIELGLAKPSRNPRRVVLTAAEIDATLGDEADFLEFSESLSAALAARRVIAVRNPADNRIGHATADALDCYVALRDAWQTELLGDWDPDMHGDPAYWRALHPAVQLPGESPLSPADVREALRLEALASVEDAMELVER